MLNLPCSVFSQQFSHGSFCALTSSLNGLGCDMTTGGVEKKTYEMKVDVQNSKSESQRIREHLQKGVGVKLIY